MCSETFADVLKQAGAKAKLLLYEGKTHTDVFLQVSHFEYEGQNSYTRIQDGPLCTNLLGNPNISFRCRIH